MLPPELPARLRSLRTSRKWTLDHLATQTGLSKPFLSRLETGSRQPSLAAILSLARVFAVPVATLFESPSEENSCIITQPDATLIQNPNGTSHTPLGAPSKFNLHPIRVTISQWRRGEDRSTHDGEEWLYVLSGKLRLRIGEKDHDLSPGQAAHFDSRLPHRLDALDGNEAEIILIASPVPPTHHPRVPPQDLIG